MCVVVGVGEGGCGGGGGGGLIYPVLFVIFLHQKSICGEIRHPFLLHTCFEWLPACDVTFAKYLHRIAEKIHFSKMLEFKKICVWVP